MPQGHVFDLSPLQPWLVVGLGLFAALGALAFISSLSRTAASLLGGRRRARPRLSLLFVVQDGAHGLEGLLRPLLAPLSSGEGLPFDWECIVVDDHSTDDTFAILQRLARDFHLLRAIRLADPDADSFPYGGFSGSAHGAAPGPSSGLTPDPSPGLTPDPLCQGLHMCRGSAVLSFDLRSEESWSEAAAVVLSLERHL